MKYLKSIIVFNLLFSIMLSCVFGQGWFSSKKTLLTETEISEAIGGIQTWIVVYSYFLDENTSYEDGTYRKVKHGPYKLYESYKDINEVGKSTTKMKSIGDGVLVREGNYETQWYVDEDGDGSWLYPQQVGIWKTYYKSESNGIESIAEYTLSEDERRGGRMFSQIQSEKLFYKDGTLSKVRLYKDGDNDGLWEEYNHDGELIFSETWKEDKKVGPFIEYYTEVKESKVYHNPGEEPEFVFKKGGLKAKGSYNNTAGSGSSWMSDPFESAKPADKFDGLYQSYSISGNLTQEGIYKNGSKNGEFKFFNDDGLLTKTATYKEEKIVGKGILYNNGEAVGEIYQVDKYEQKKFNYPNGNIRYTLTEKCCKGVDRYTEQKIYWENGIIKEESNFTIKKWTTGGVGVYEQITYFGIIKGYNKSGKPILEEKYSNSGKLLSRKVY